MIVSPHGFFGALCGYYSAKFFSPRFPSLIFNFGKIKLHLHHWLYSLLILIFSLKYDFLPFPPFSYGFLGGMIFQGIYCYDNWHMVIIFKKKKINVFN